MPTMTWRPGYRTMEMNGGSSAPYLARTPSVPLFCALFRRGGNRRAFRLPGAGGDHFHCTVEPLAGRMRRRIVLGFWLVLLSFWVGPIFLELVFPLFRLERQVTYFPAGRHTGSCSTWRRGHKDCHCWPRSWEGHLLQRPLGYMRIKPPT